MRLAYKIGFSLSFVHGIFCLVVLFLPHFELLESIVGFTVYAPLVAFDWLGLPVFSGPQSWGFSNPSGFGYALAIGLWAGVWFLVGLSIELFASKKQ